MSNQQLDPNNSQTNQNAFPQEDNYNMNIPNYNLDILQQKQMLDNSQKEKKKKKIDICIKENNLSELANILKLYQLDKNTLTSYISENIENIEIINILLNSGADVNAYVHFDTYSITEADKVNLLMISIMTENTQLFKLLLNYNPDVLQEDKNNKNSLFYYITFHNDNNDPKMLHQLLSLNPNGINSEFYEKETNITHNLLTYAVSKNKKELCSILIEDKCNLNYQIKETGDTVLHLVVKNDNVEIAKLLYNLSNIDRSLKNNDGKTAKNLGEERKGNIFFHIICKEKDNNINNSQNKNNSNIIINDANIKINKKKNELIHNIASNLNELNFNENEKNYYSENIPQDNYIVPIEFSNVDYTTYLSMGQEMKLCLNLFKEEEVLIKEKEELVKKREKIKEKFEKLKEEQDKKKKELAELDNQNTKKDNEISQLKQEIAIKKKEISNYQNKNKAYSQFLSKLNSESAPSQNTEQINEQEINTESNINNENNENHSQENLNIEQYQNEPLSPEKLKFLIEKFDSKAYERSYIVKCLQKDLEDYQLYIQSELEAKREKINDIITQLQSVVNEIDSNYTVRLYGSYSTGLCLPWSDIDTVIESNDGKYDPNFLNKLNGKLAHKDWVKEQNYIDRATIPIIKLISKDEYNFHIDISMSSENHFGLKTVTLVNEYLKEYKVLKPIILALKTLLKNGNLNDPYKGGLSSYGLILMVVSFIQSEIDSDKYNENSPTLIGETFLNVLGHYGIFFDYNNYVIITYPIRAKNYPNEKELTYQFIPNTHELIIVDPLNKTNNVAKSTFQFMNIKMGFLIAFMVAKEDCECGCHYEYLKNSRDMEHGHCILKRIFNSIKRFKDANKNIY